jgi:glycosyltransferase involved in cell wall biosynthesis
MTDDRVLWILTPLVPGRLALAAEARDSVLAASGAAGRAGWRVRWIVSVDGPAEAAAAMLGADALVIGDPAGRSCRGVSVARNRALSRAAGGWVYPLDDDDLLDAAGLAAMLSDPALDMAGWASSNRVLLDGQRTVHWRDELRRWLPGDLEEAWAAPFPFHPNSVLVRTDIALAAGGWPAVPANEDLGFALAVSALADGVSLTHTVTRYRAWDGQAVNAAAYRPGKAESWTMIGAVVNARRAIRGDAPIRIPDIGERVGNEPA